MVNKVKRMIFFITGTVKFNSESLKPPRVELLSKILITISLAMFVSVTQVLALSPPPPEPPALTVSVNQAQTTLTLNWVAANDAEYYIVDGYLGGAWRELGSTSNTSATYNYADNGWNMNELQLKILACKSKPWWLFWAFWLGDTCSDHSNAVSPPDIGSNGNSVSMYREWFWDYGGSQAESHGHYIVQVTDSGYVQVGETGMLPNSAKIFVVKVDQNGALMWQKEFGSAGHNLGNSMIETSDAYWVVGSQDQDSVLLKLDKVSGDTLIEKKYDLGGSDALESIVETATGFVGIGYHSADDPNNTFFTGGQGIVVFFDQSGNKLSQQDVNQYLAHPYRIRTYNNSFIISGLTAGAQDFGVLKYSNTFDLVWDRVIGGDQPDHNFAMDIAADGSIYLAGHSLTGVQNWDTYTVKLNQLGDTVWEKRHGNPRGFDPRYIHDEVWDLTIGANGDVFVVAGTGDEYWNYSACNENGCSDQWEVYILRYAPDGTLLWENTYIGYGGEDWAGEAIAYTSDGGLIVAVDNGKFGFLKLMPY